MEKLIVYTVIWFDNDDNLWRSQGTFDSFEKAQKEMRRKSMEECQSIWIVDIDNDNLIDWIDEKFWKNKTLEDVEEELNWWSRYDKSLQVYDSYIIMENYWRIISYIIATEQVQ